MERRFQLLPQNSISGDESDGEANDTKRLLNTALLRRIQPQQQQLNHSNSIETTKQHYPMKQTTNMTIYCSYPASGTQSVSIEEQQSDEKINDNFDKQHKRRRSLVNTKKGNLPTRYQLYTSYNQENYQPISLIEKKYSNNAASTSQQSQQISTPQFPVSTNSELPEFHHYQHIINDRKQSGEYICNSDTHKDDRRVSKELRHLKEVYRKRKRRLLQSRKRSASTDSIDSLDEMYNETKKPTCKDIMFGHRMRKWAFWFIVAFLAALTIKDVISLIIEYSENPKQSDMNIMFNDSMTMPNITFCMSRAQAWSHFRLNQNESTAEWDKKIQDQLKNMTNKSSFLNAPWDYRMVMETYNLISALTSMERETTLEGSANTINKFSKQERFISLRSNLKMWLKVLSDRDVTFEEFTQKVGKETLKRSMQRFQRTTYNENESIKTEVKITWISQLQLCFQPTFDEKNFKPIEDQGNFFTMVLSHNAEKLENVQVECMSIDFHGRASSNSRFSGSKGQARDGFNDEQCMGMVHETTVEVKARYKMLPNDEQGTACRDQEEGQDSEFDCHARCRMEFIKKICKCTAPTLSYLIDKEKLKNTPLCDYSTCNIDIQNANYTDNGCTQKCYRDCDQIRYEIDHERKGKSVRPDLTTIYLNWGSFEYLTLEQDWVWSVSTFIAALGGSIGMWLGLSILSLIQGGTYMYTYLTQNVIKKKRRPSSGVMDMATEQKMATITTIPNTTDDAHTIAANPFSSPFKAKHNNVNKSPPPEYQ